MWTANDIILIGKNGYVVGNDGYFEKLNDGILKVFLWDARNYNYYSSLERAAEKMQAAFDELYDDLKNNISVIRYTDRRDREDFIKVLQDCIGICKMVSKRYSLAEKSIDILNLSDYGTKPKSYMSESRIEDGFKIIENYRELSRWDKERLIKDAMSRDGVSLSWLKPEQLKLIDQISENRDEKFLYDVFIKYLYENERGEFKTKCGKEICSDVYFEYIHKKLIYSPSLGRISSFSDRYDKLVKEQLKKIAETIEEDLRREVVTLNSNAQQYRENILKAAENIDKLIGTSLTRSAKDCFERMKPEDVTQKFNDLIRAQDAKYKAVLERKNGLVFDQERDEIYISVLPKLEFFVSQVETGAIVDLKNQPGWEQRAYIYEGELLRRDAFGNMLYGYVGKLFGYDDEFLCAGAGAYHLKSCTLSWRYWDTYFDDPDDTEMIRRGIKIYNDTH